MRLTTKVLATVGVSAVAVASFAGSAFADPSENPPADTAIVAVGSDTIQFLAGQFQSDSVGTPYDFQSFDATPAGTITPKVGCTGITRPNGSGAGITALASSQQLANGSYCVDVARASRVPSATDPTGLVFVPIAGDAVTYTSEQSTNVPANLSIAALTAIYSCNDSLDPAISNPTGGPVTEDEIGGTGTDTVAPVLPQTSSGTRATFLKAINVTTPGSCVVNGANTLNGSGDGTAIEENEGTNEIFGRTSIVNTADLVFPYSVGVDLSETVHGHGSSINEPGPLVLRSVNGIAPTTGKGSAIVINKKATIQRQLFFVSRRNTGADSKTSYIPGYLQGFLGTGFKASKKAPAGSVCGKTALQDDASYGFLSLSKSCGIVTSSDLT